MTGTPSVHCGAARPAALYASASAHRRSSRCPSRTVIPAVRTGSVQANPGSPAALRRPSIRDRSSVKCTALTGVTPGWIGSSVKADGVTVTVNPCVALRPPASPAVTRIAAVPRLIAVNVTRAAAATALTTSGAADDAV